jgi:AcrR family transcriptional regulator
VARDFPERVVGKITDGAARKAGKLSQTASKMSAKAAHLAEHAERLDRLAAHLDALELWTRSAPSARQPRFTRQHIAEAAVRVADAEGFDAVSMRRLAAELDAGTMTLYHYVRTKDELLTLVFDAVLGEVVLPDGHELPADWRDAITLIAHRSLGAVRRHPWMLDINDDPGIGPNSVRHFDQTMQAVEKMGGTLTDQLDLVFAVDEFVFGFALQERNNFIHDEPGTDRKMIAYVETLIQSGNYPKLREMSDAMGTAALWGRIHDHGRDVRRFDRTLRRLLDGFAHDLGL